MNTGRSSRPRSALRGLALLGILAAGAVAPLAPAHPAVAQADLTFPSPQRYAVVSETPARLRRLYRPGDVLIDPANPRQQVIIDRIAPHSLVVRAHPTARPRRVTVGTPIPGAPGRILADIVLLSRIRYQVRTVDREPRAEPVVVSIAGSTAVLQREVRGTVSPRAAGPARARPSPAPRPAPRPTPDLGLLARVPVGQIDEGTFVVDEEFFEPVLETLRRLVPATASGVRAAFPQRGDVRVNMSSPFVDGTLHRQGFTVRYVKVAQAFGLQAGDTVLSLNGRAVNSPLNAWWAFQELLIKQHELSRLRVEIERDGALVVNTYQIR